MVTTVVEIIHHNQLVQEITVEIMDNFIHLAHQALETTEVTTVVEIIHQNQQVLETMVEIMDNFIRLVHRVLETMVGIMVEIIHQVKRTNANASRNTTATNAQVPARFLQGMTAMERGMENMSTQASSQAILRRTGVEKLTSE